MKTKLILIILLGFPFMVNAKVDKNYNFYVDLVNNGWSIDTNIRLFGTQYKKFELSNYQKNEDTLLQVFNPALLTDSIEAKYLIINSFEVAPNFRNTPQNFQKILVGIRFINAKQWIPICDSSLISNYLNVVDKKAVKEYTKLFRGDGSKIALTGLGTIVYPAVLSFLVYGTVSFVWFLPYTAPMYATGAILLTAGGLYYTSHNEKYIFDKITKAYNSKT